MIGMVTDSASQMPPALAARFDVDVVPVTVTIDGVDHREGVDIDPADFWTRFADGTPEVQTSQPSPGSLAASYRALHEAGAEEIVSIHVGAAHSGTLNSARLAAEMVDVPVHLVDTATASFGVSCCVWEAATCRAAGGSVDEIVAAATAVVPTVGTTFIIQAVDFASRSGRLPALPEGHEGVMVLGGLGGAVDVLSTGHTVDELCDQMVAPFLASGSAIRAGVSLADPSTLVFTEGIEARLRAADVDVEMVRYEVGPSIAAHTGPGTAGGFWYPVDA